MDVGRSIADTVDRGLYLVAGLSVATASDSCLDGGSTSGLDMDHLVATVEQVDGVIELHHLHVWELDEHHRAMEAHVAIKDGLADDLETTKSDIKRCLADKFQIQHSTLEFEYPDSQHNNCTDSFLIYQH